jgi:hypothetical protein
MSKKKRKKSQEEEEREERILDQFKMRGRLPTPPPGHFHDTGVKQRGRKQRHGEKHRLKDLAIQHNRSGTD